MAVALAKMGVPSLEVWDDDDVSEHNIAMSAYRMKDFMRPKVEALREIVKEASGLTIEIRKEKYAGREPLKGAIVVCVDTMEARQAVWKRVRMDPEVSILIDTRTAGKLLWVFAVAPCDPDDAEYYDHHVAYGSKQAAPHMCGLHGFMPMSYAAASLAVSNLTSWWMSGIKDLHRKELVASPAIAEEES